jgi:hypothetical protein
MQRPFRLDHAIADAAFARALNRGHCIARMDDARRLGRLLFTPAIRWNNRDRTCEKD